MQYLHVNFGTRSQWLFRMKLDKEPRKELVFAGEGRGTQPGLITRQGQIGQFT